MVQSKVIRDRIIKGGENRLYVIGDFADMQNDDVVTRTLARFVETDFLVRITQGLYLYPSRNRFGIQKPSIDSIALAIAEKDKTRIIPSGLSALNILRLSTQVPMNAVYITDGTPRTIQVGNRTIVFKKGTPKYFSFMSRRFAMIVLAMKEIGEKNINEKMLNNLMSLVSQEDAANFSHDILIAPQWIRKLLNKKTNER